VILFREIDTYKQAFFAAMDATLVLFNGTELGDYEKTNLINRVFFCRFYCSRNSNSTGREYYRMTHLNNVI